jgi:uncharacterized protein YdeI (YjbR/CyaY-like superfamily)
MNKISQGVAHKIPKDLNDAISYSNKTIELWNSLTPLARNEWICWVISVKKIETRESHIKRLVEDISKGKRRPCCWAGCPHRK